MPRARDTGRTLSNPGVLQGDVDHRMKAGQIVHLELAVNPTVQVLVLTRLEPVGNGFLLGEVYRHF